MTTGPVFLAKAAPSGFGKYCTQVHPCRFVTEVASVVSQQRSTVYVAKGRYFGDGNPDHAVVRIDGSGGWNVTVLGGWNGAPTGPIVRDPAANESILDGAGVQRVIYVGPAAQPVFDGLTITGGRATGTSSPDSDGGGIFLDLADPVIARCVITGNVARYYGGGILSLGGHPIITACAILSNSCQDGGGGLTVSGGALMLSDSTVAGNQSNNGAALDVDGAYLSIARNRIVGNHGNSSDCILETTDATLFGTLANNLVAGAKNVALWVCGYRLQLVHNTLANNPFGVSAACAATVTMTNNIVAGSVFAPVSAGTGATITGTNNLFWPNASPPWTGANTVLGDPRFLDPVHGNFRLGPGSAADDRGVLVPLVQTDLTGHSRCIDPAPDIGAYESYQRRLPLLLR